MATAPRIYKTWFSRLLGEGPADLSRPPCGFPANELQALRFIGDPQEASAPEGLRTGLVNPYDVRGGF